MQIPTEVYNASGVLEICELADGMLATYPSGDQVEM